MEKLNDTKIEDTLRSLKKTPTSEWSNSAEEELKNFTLTQQEFKLYKYFIYTFMRNKLLLASVVTIAVFVVAISAFSVYYLGRIKNSTGYSKEETIAILSKVLANNSVSTIQEGTALSPARNSMAAGADMASSLTIAPIIDDFEGANYRYTRTTVTEGPAASKCTDAFSYSKISAISDTYEYRPNGGADYQSYMYKYATYTANNEITNLTVSKYENNKSIYFEYAGGNYAVKNVYEQGPNTISVLPASGVAEDTKSLEEPATPDSTTVNEEPDYDTLVAQYFGPDAQIVDTVTEGANTYYILRYSYSLYCNGQQTKAVYENKVNSKTYTISNTKTYFESADAGNLINSTTVLVETKTITDSEANSIFTLGVNVPVREVVYPYVPAEEYSVEKEATRIVDDLKSTSTYVLIPEGFEISYGYSYAQNSKSIPANSNYREDRAFYALGALGDQMYEIYNPSDAKNYISPESNWNFVKTSTNERLYVESFKVGTTIAQVSESKTQSYTDIENKSAVNVQVKVNGANVNATLLTFTASQNWVYLRETMDSATSTSAGSATDSRMIAPDEGNGSSTYDYAYLIFEYQGHVYVASKDVYSGEQIVASDLVLKSYNPSNASDYAFLKSELISKANTPIPVDPGIGDGSSGSSEGSTGIACTMEAKQCSDGSYVGRNPSLNCEFDACP